MVSEDKLIKQGIRLTDAWFEKFKKQIEHDLSLCETYEEFIERTKEYTTANILINSGYAAEMQSLITQILNNHRFQRASQRALIEETINNNVGHLIQDVGEEIKETVRDVVKEGYDEGSHPREIARNINGRIDSINSRRARTITRTEVKRTDTVANYVRHKEQGATGFNVQCRPDCCPVCAKDYAHKDPKKQQARLNRIAQMKRDKVDDPLVRGKGETIGGNVEFSMDDTLMLPPRHPNCRCTAMFVYGGTVETEEPTETTTTTTEPEVLPEPTKEQLRNNLTPTEIKRYKRWQKEIKSKGKFTEDFIQKRIKDLEGLKRKALGLPSLNDNQPQTPKPKPTPKQKPKTTTEKKPKTTQTETQKEPTKWDKMSFKELAEHHGASYDGLIKMPEEGKEYHVFREKLDNGKQFRIFVEKGAVNAYQKGGVATINEIVHEVFKVPEVYRKETDQIWFKNTQKGIKLNPRGKLDTLKTNTGGYNTFRSRSLRSAVIKGQSKKFKGYDDPNHRIVINPKSFKKLKSDIDKITWRDREGETTSWKHIIHHEFAHSIDDSRKIWRDNLEKLHNREEYQAIEEEEPYFTKYANTQPGESFAEHGGYISYMLANPEEQSKKITIHRYGRDENNRITTLEEKITFEEYKQRYPKHYEYFTNLINGGMNDVVA